MKVLSLHVTKTLISIVFKLIFIFSSAFIAAGLQIGAGGYTTSLPAGESGPSNSSGGSAIPLVSPGFSWHVQTNDFWSSVIWDYFGEPYSQNMYPHPLALKAVSDGLGISYPTYTALNNEYHNNYLPEDIHVGVAGLNSSNTTVAGYSDWAVTAEWNSDSSMQATFGRGLPFIYIIKSGGNAIVSITTGFEGI